MLAVLRVSSTHASGNQALAMHVATIAIEISKHLQRAKQIVTHRRSTFGISRESRKLQESVAKQRRREKSTPQRLHVFMQKTRKHWSCQVPCTHADSPSVNWRVAGRCCFVESCGKACCWELSHGCCVERRGKSRVSGRITLTKNTPRIGRNAKS